MSMLEVPHNRKRPVLPIPNRPKGR